MNRKEHDQKMRKKVLSLVLALCMVLTLVPGTAFAAAEGGGSETAAANFEALQSALNEASNTKITLTGDIEVTAALTISHDVTIVGDGSHTVKYGESYTGTMFTVSNGAALTLQGVTGREAHAQRCHHRRRRQVEL